MFPEERRREIMATLHHQGRCLVGDLARVLNVSEVTIRQDLDVLDQQGLLRRTHGGAMLAEKIGLERPFQVEESSHRAGKERIAAAAVELVSSGDTLLLDVGTTVTEAARQLTKSQKNPIVITNSLNIASILEVNPGITTIVTGGTLRPQQHSLVNPFGQLVLERVNADIAFLGISGIEADHGLTNVNVPEAEMKSLFIKTARRCVVLADSTKVGKVALAKITDVEEVDTLITDRGADVQEIARLRERGLEVLLV